MFFEMIKYFQGKLILAAIFWLVICCFDCSSANKGIDKINDANSSDYRIPSMHRAPFAGLIIVIIILVIALVTPLSFLSAEE